MSPNTAQNINILGDFCGKRDLAELSRENLKKKYNMDQADVMVLFGGSILAGGDVLAKAIKDGIARKYVIVGGAGHTTETLRQRVHAEYPDIETNDLPEAEVFLKYLQQVYGCKADYLETKSTNCGNNITYLLELLEKENVPFHSVILSQDATMQNRMDAGMRKFAPKDTVIINYATYAAKVTGQEDNLTFEEQIHGMWTVERYVQLLMGEIPRLTDNVDGYGPQGKDYIAHVDIPEAVKNAFEELKLVFGNETREANPLYASK